VHIALAKRLIHSNATDKPALGDRIPHFMVCGSVCVCACCNTAYAQGVLTTQVVGVTKKSERGVTPREVAVGNLDLGESGQREGTQLH